MAEAEKKLSKQGGFLRSFFGVTSSTREEAAEMYIKAANNFKLAKAWAQAGTALERAAAVYEQLPEMQYEAAAKYSDAGKALRTVDATRALAAFDKAVSLYSDAARFQQCARLRKDAAEILEDRAQLDQALDAYTAAADFYDMDDAKSNANSMRVKVAAISATLGKYSEAAEMYESVAQTALANNLLKYGAREHLLRAGICRLCLADLVGAQRALEHYAKLDVSFPTSREGTLLTAIVEAVDQSDVDAFTNHVFEYDNVSKLDEWKTTMLLKIKNDIKADDDDLT